MKEAAEWRTVDNLQEKSKKLEHDELKSSSRVAICEDVILRTGRLVVVVYWRAITLWNLRDRLAKRCLIKYRLENWRFWQYVRSAQPLQDLTGAAFIGPSKDPDSENADMELFNGDESDRRARAAKGASRT